MALKKRQISAQEKSHIKLDMGRLVVLNVARNEYENVFVQVHLFKQELAS